MYRNAKGFLIYVSIHSGSLPVNQTTKQQPQTETTLLFKYRLDTQGISGSQVPKWSLRQLHSFGSSLVLLFLLDNAQCSLKLYCKNAATFGSPPELLSFEKSSGFTSCKGIHKTFGQNSFVGISQSYYIVKHNTLLYLNLHESLASYFSSFPFCSLKVQHECNHD